MEFKELEYILAINKYKNITKASQSLYISQPSLSKYLKNLESNLGVKLFNRFGNSFVLTYAGEIYIKNAKEIISIKERLLNELHDISDFKKGKINIAFPYTRGSYMIPETIPKFKEIYPNIEINLIENHSSDLEHLLLNSDAEIAILNTPITNKDIDYISLGDEEIVLLVSLNHPLSKKFKNKEKDFPKVTIDEFSNDRFILQYETQRTGQIAQRIFKDSKFTPKEIFYTRNFESSARLVSKDFGVCFASATHLKHLYLENVRAFSLKNNNTLFELVVAFRRGTYLSKPAKDYIEILKSSI